MRMIGGRSIMGACAGRIKPPAGERSFALHASGDDALVNSGNSIRFRVALWQGFFPFATGGNGIVAFCAAAL